MCFTTLNQSHLYKGSAKEYGGLWLYHLTKGLTCKHFDMNKISSGALGNNLAPFLKETYHRSHNNCYLNIVGNY